jgi:hypothetical protein
MSPTQAPPPCVMSQVDKSILNATRHVDDQPHTLANLIQPTFHNHHDQCRPPLLSISISQHQASLSSLPRHTQVGRLTPTSSIHPRHANPAALTTVHRTHTTMPSANARKAARTTAGGCMRVWGVEPILRDEGSVHLPCCAICPLHAQFGNDKTLPVFPQPSWGHTHMISVFT